MKKIKIVFLVILIISVILTGSVIGTSTSDLNNEKNEIDNKIKEAEDQQAHIKKEISETMSEIQKLDASIAESEEQLDELRSQLNTLESEIEETQSKLDEAEENYNKQQDLLEKRLVAQYKAGKTSYLDVLLNSSSISDFISKYHYVTLIAQKDTDLLNQIQEEKEIIEKAKKDLEEQQAEYKIKKANAEKQNVILKNNQAVKESYVAKLSDDEKELQKQIDGYNSEMRQIEAKIRQAEEEAKKNQQSSGGNYNKYTGGTMAWPTRITKRVNSVYAPNGRYDIPVSGSTHRGVDIYAPLGTSIYPAADGVVVTVSRGCTHNYSGYCSCGGGYGNYVVVSHGNGIYTLYGHGTSVPGNINVGTTVTTDTVILYSGTTGWSYGAHLHFEVCVGSIRNKVNPCTYLGIENKEGYVQ